MAGFEVVFLDHTSHFRGLSVQEMMWDGLASVRSSLVAASKVLRQKPRRPQSGPEFPLVPPKYRTTTTSTSKSSRLLISLRIGFRHCGWVRRHCWRGSVSPPARGAKHNNGGGHRNIWSPRLPNASPRLPHSARERQIQGTWNPFPCSRLPAGLAIVR